VSLREPCWQCELDIPHVCYHGMPNARWGWTDEAVAALEGAQRNGFMGGPPAAQRSAIVTRKRSSLVARMARSTKRPVTRKKRSRR
jgi:hypothetical protein